MTESSDTEDRLSRVEERVKCAACSRRFEDPRLLSCHHTFCRACLRLSVINDSVTCPVCRTVHDNLTADGLEGLPSSPRIIHLLKVINKQKWISLAIRERQRDINPQYRIPTIVMVTPSRTDSNGDVIVATLSMTLRWARVEVNVKCLVCSRKFEDPRLLSCPHTFCRACLRCSVINDSVTCPQCRTVLNLSADGLEGLPSSPRAIQLLKVVNAHASLDSLAIRERHVRDRNPQYRTPYFPMVTPSRTDSDERQGDIAMVTPSMPVYAERHGDIAMVTPSMPVYAERRGDIAMVTPSMPVYAERHGDIAMVTPSMPVYAERHGDIAMVTPSMPVYAERHGDIAMVTPSMPVYAERRGTVFIDSDVFLGGQPVSIAVSPAADRLYVTVIDHHTVLICDARGKLMKTAYGPDVSPGVSPDVSPGVSPDVGPGVRPKGWRRWFNRPTGQAVNKPDVGPGAGPRGGKLGFDRPRGIAVNKDGDVIVADTDNHRVVILDRDGEYKSMFGTHGEKDGQFVRPHGVAVDDACTIYVCDTDNHRVQVFTRDGKYMRTFNKPDNVSGVFRPLYLTIARTTGRVYVTDYGNHTVYVYTPLGRCIACFGTKGSGAGEMDKPRGICVDDDGRVIIADRGNHRVHVFNGDGTFHCTLVLAHDTPRLSWSEGLTIDKNGRVFVVDWGNKRVLVF